MNPALGILAMVAVLGGSALAQTTQSPSADPLSVKPVPSQARSPESASIRMKIEQAGYTDVTDLARDSMGIWRGRARKGNDTVDVMVDKGGRIKNGPVR
jgi:hypothetical protein